MQTKHFGIEYLSLKIKGLDKKSFAELLVLSTLLSSTQVKELVRSGLSSMSKNELQKLFSLLHQNVEETKCLFHTIGDKKRNHDSYHNLLCKIAGIKNISGHRLSIIELKEITEMYAVKLSDLLNDAEVKLITPQLMVDYLDEYIAGQAEAKKAVALVFYNHLLRTGLLNTKTEGAVLPHINLMLVGPTGSGKTYMLRLLATLFDVPFNIFDMASVTASGYVGESFDAVFTNLLIQTNGNSHLAQKGIVVLDEIDKIAVRDNRSTLSSIDVQMEMLKRLDGGIVNVSERHGRDFEKKPFDTSNLLFIAAGAFSGIDKIASQRLGLNSLGFNSTQKASSFPCSYPQLIHGDLIRFGLMPELVGRFNKMATLLPLTSADILAILQSKKDSSLNKYQEYFRLHNITLNVTNEVFELVANKVVQTGLGARYIDNCLDTLLSDFLFEAPMLEGAKINVDKDCARELLK